LFEEIVMTDTMTQATTPTYAPGTPMWIDLGTPDLAASTRFYTQLFGWQAEDTGEQTGHYTMFRQGGKVVAAVGPLMSPGQPTAWTTYISTANTEETAKKVTDAGGQVLSPPMQVMEEGSMAVFQDPTGAAFAVWQPKRMKGAELVNKPNSLGWNELATRDIDAARAFYTRVFPWTTKIIDMGGGQQYTEWLLDGKSIGGAMQIGGMIPASVPPHWLVYFVVANTDETIKKAQELGAKVLNPASDIPQGRMAVLGDPQGAPFAVIALSQ
jgi:predicted enzyme related to lactoylglutathione lyase